MCVAGLHGNVHTSKCVLGAKFVVLSLYIDELPWYFSMNIQQISGLCANCFGVTRNINVGGVPASVVWVFHLGKMP